MSKELILLSLEDPLRARQLVHTLLTKDRNDADRREILATIRDFPQRALALLQNDPNALGVTPRGAADILDLVVEAVDDDDRAGALLTEHVSPERLVELLEGRGDLASSAALIAPFPLLMQAALTNLLQTVENADFTLNALFALQFWADKFRARGESDYRRFLDQVIGRHQVRDLIAYDIWLMHGKPDEEDMDELLRGELELADLDQDKAIEAIRAMSEKFRFSASDVADARESYTEEREERERNEQKVVDPAAEAKKAAKDITF